MYARLIKPPARSSFFLFGPRGTGKSSWVKARYPNAPYLDLLDAEVFTDLLASPARMGRYFTCTGPPATVVIDEIQKVPALLDEVHRLVETTGTRFVMTGSSGRKLRRAGVNLLAGRALTLNLHPLTARELGKDFDLPRALLHGMLPAAVRHEQPAKFLKSYVHTYLREEIMQEGLARRLPAFSRFLEAASFSQASVLNVSAVAQDCGVPRKTVEEYLRVLDDLMIGVRLAPFTRRAKRRVVAHPKFYFFDGGVYRALRPRGPLDSQAEIDGAALETLVLQELRALNSYLDLDYALHYWRTPDGREVDFVLYGERGIKAIEVTRSSRFRPADIRGLEAFLADYPAAEAFFLYAGNRRLKEGKVQVLPLPAFFESASELLMGNATIR
ncbi:MAG: ATP-binding protein [Elusimicrobia bacterium]|nr:ATP-binding protein [Elusimicrobiota bacterium]